MIYDKRQPVFTVWERDFEYDYFVGYCYGWDDHDYYWRCGYLVERIE